MTLVEEWIKKEISDKHIRYFEYNEFSQIDEIGRGAFGKVSKANLADTGLVALKILFSKNSKEEINEDNDEFVKELKLLREVDYHQNINRILGLTKDSEHYILVLEYANEGSLRDYLKKNFTSLKWNDKIQMALDITNGLKFLHSKEIIHRDLHSKNILVNNRKLLIADLGLSKKLKEVMSSNSLGNRRGMVEYTEPQCLKNRKYKKDNKSDIYSLGILFWEISSGHPPFSDCSQDLVYHYIKNDEREDPIEGTPPKYQELYQKCWESEPEKRPNIKEVYVILSRLNAENPFDIQFPQSIDDDEGDSKVYNDDFTISSNCLNPSLIRNLLIVGRTLSGKSTLSNVLCNTDDFSENEYIIKKDFEWNGLKYYMIEIVFGSIEKKVYNEIIDLMPEGISQVLFVVDKSFTTEEKIMLESYKRIIFETGILEYVTIIRNKFDDFSIKNECERDKKHVFEENEIITEIVKSCNNTIYINNPPIFTCDEDEIIVNRDIRKRSRAILLNYLEKECQEEYYKLENWDDLQSKIAGYSKLNKEFTEEVKKADNTIDADDLYISSDCLNPNSLSMLNKLQDDHKEEPIEGSSSKYYQECDGEPKSSPDTEEVYEILNTDKNKLGKNRYTDTDRSEKSIVEEYITYYEYSEFKIIRKIGNGSFGSVYCASWKNTDQIFALKCFNGDKTTLKEVVNEIKICKRVDFHENILQFHGIAVAKNADTIQKYALVLEFADSGTLRTYLSDCFNDLKWDDKYRFAFQLASAIACMHKCDVIHCDLHADNVFVHQKKIKLTDFGLSRKITASSSNPNTFGLIPYIDPKSKLYTECWKYEPHERPNMQDIVSTLKALISPDQNSTNPDDVNKKGNTSLKIPELSVGTIDINKSLSVGSDVNVLNNIEPESNSSLVSVAQPKMPDGKSKPRNTKSKEQEKFNTQYSKEKEIYIVGSRSILFSFFKSEFTKLEGSLEIEGFENLEIINLKDLKLNSLKINDCSQLNKVDLSELTKLTSLYVRDCPNLTTDDCSLIGLTSLKSLKIINCSQFKKIFDLSLFPELTSLETSGCSQLNQITGFSRLPKLTSLYVINCPKLTKLDCSSTKTLTELEVSDLEELNCSNTSIEELSLNLCPNITKLDCLNNKKLIKLDLSNCSYLDFLDCTGSKLTSLDLSYCSKSITVKPSDLIITRKLENFRNILLVGRTGGGKSTLANVLTDTSNFKERAYAVSQTKNFKKIDFKWNEENFRVVDTIGVGGTKQSTENTLFKIAEGILSMPEGLNHVLYVIDGRFTEEEISTFNMITDSIFKSGILDYVTIVRTKFSNFRDKRVCEVDIKKIREESKENELIAEIINSCNGFIHVDNPPIDIVKEDDDDDYEDRILANKNVRKKSRKKILDYLEEKYQDKRYKSENWDELCNKIVEYTNHNL
ncbi:kinase-like domain-containing protein [Rhizophagus irregularis DAOM 181602=DAOM 197198]|nr:kinase-like domain-containing protein [Rhizophagus irregularis DAOM 181602=DAOM 197198]